MLLLAGWTTGTTGDDAVAQSRPLVVRRKKGGGERKASAGMTGPAAAVTFTVPLPVSEPLVVSVAVSV